MHTAAQLSADMFRVEIAGKQASIDHLLTGWSATSRLGLVVCEPLGGLGASLLLQAAIVAFYDASPSRRRGAHYPEVFVFHSGARFGDHSSFDVWPPRKEVFVDPGSWPLLAAINNCAITHLAVPEGKVRDRAHQFGEAEAALERIQAAWCYAVDGRAPDHDVSIAVRDARALQNASWTVDPGPLLSLLAEAARLDDGAPVELSEGVRYAEAVRARLPELTSAHRAEAARRLGDLGAGSVEVRETYRRIPVGEALSRL